MEVRGSESLWGCLPRHFWLSVHMARCSRSPRLGSNIIAEISSRSKEPRKCRCMHKTGKEPERPGQNTGEVRPQAEGTLPAHSSSAYQISALRPVSQRGFGFGPHNLGIVRRHISAVSIAEEERTSPHWSWETQTEKIRPRTLQTQSRPLFPHSPASLSELSLVKNPKHE